MNIGIDEWIRILRGLGGPNDEDIKRQAEEGLINIDYGNGVIKPPPKDKDGTWSGEKPVVEL